MRQLRVVVMVCASLVALGALGETPTVSPGLWTYEHAIAKARTRPTSDRRVDLQRCVRGWESVAVQRAGLQRGVPQGAGSFETRGLLLEIGNSGFPAYSDVRVDGTTLTSSLGGSVEVSGSELGWRIREAHANPALLGEGSADASVLDGACYFLTVFGKTGASSIAVYGPPDSSRSGLLISGLVKTARTAQRR